MKSPISNFKSPACFGMLSILPFAFLIFNSALAQLPANNLSASASAVMTDTSGNLTAPLNFFSANSNTLSASVFATNFSSRNLIPAGAMYDNGTSAFDDFTGETSGYSVSGIISNGLYGIYLGGNDYDVYGAPGWALSPGTFRNMSGVFLAQTNVIWIGGNFTSVPVQAQLYLLATNVSIGAYYMFASNFYGNFVGTIDPTTTIPPGPLNSASVQITTNALNDGYSGNGSLNSVFSQNLIGAGGSTFDQGSTFSLWHAGGSGYCDINFHTTSSTSNMRNQASYTLWFAIGVGGHSVAQDGIYFTPYIESYLGQYPFYFVGNGQIFGGLYSSANHDGDWLWYQDGTTNTTMFRINRANGIVSNYVDVACASNLLLRPISVAPTAARLGANGFGFWNSNGVLYVTKSANGSTISSTTLIAQ
jgi:hypothetical protein